MALREVAVKEPTCTWQWCNWGEDAIPLTHCFSPSLAVKKVRYPFTARWTESYWKIPCTSRVLNPEPLAPVMTALTTRPARPQWDLLQVLKTDSADWMKSLFLAGKDLVAVGIRRWYFMRSQGDVKCLEIMSLHTVRVVGNIGWPTHFLGW